MKKLGVLGMAVVSAVLRSAPFSLYWSPTKLLFISVDRADARIDRPLTPLSVAGVRGIQRRSTLRAE